MVVGDKSKGQLSRVLGKNMALTFNQIGRDVPTFSDAAGVADLIAQSGVEYDTIAIVYNKFVSALSYEPATVEISNEKFLKESRQYMHFLSYYLANCLQPDSVHMKWRMISPRTSPSFHLPTLSMLRLLKLMLANRVLGGLTFACSSAIVHLVL